MSAKRFLRSCATMMLGAMLVLPPPVARADQPVTLGVAVGSGSRTLCLHGAGANGDTPDATCIPIGTFDPVAHTATFNSLGGDGAVTASMLASGAAAANLGFTPPKVFNIVDYGAKCDGVTNDNTAINAALTAAYNSTAYQNSNAVEITGPSGGGTQGCVMNSANLTQFNKGSGSNPRPRVELSHMTWLCTGAGNVCLDALNATFIEVHDFSIRGDNVATPEICVQFGVADLAQTSRAWNSLTRVNCAGYFTFTALYNVGSEANTYSAGTLGNVYTGSGPIWSLGAITGGSGYTNGTYTGVPLTGGSCVTGSTITSCATASITVSGGAVTEVNINSVGGYAGRNYKTTDVLSAAAASIGGTGSGFSVPVASVKNYAVVLDGSNHWRSASAFLTSTLAVDTATSSTLLTAVGMNIRGSMGGIWIAGFGRPTFLNSYVYSGGATCVDMYDSGVAKWAYDFGLNCEGSPSNMFFITGPNANPSYTNFKWNGYSQGTVSVFGVDSNIASVTMNGASLTEDYLTPNVPMFGNAPIWTVSGQATVNLPTQWNAPATASNVRLTLGSTQAPPGLGPVDIMPNAAIAVSCSRLLNRNYTGPICRVQRTSDSTTLDIYPDAAGNLDKGAFQAFCTNTTCGVSIAYDQSGNANNCTQGTAASQPIVSLVSSGMNARTSMGWATATALSCGTGATINDLFATGGYLAAAVFQNSNSQLNRLAFKAGATGGWEVRAPGTLSPYLSLNVPATTSAGVWNYTTASISPAGHVYDLTYNDASLSNVPTLGIDGLAASLAATQPVGPITTDAAVPLLLGNNQATAGTRGFIGQIADFVAWKTTPSAVQIEALRRNFGAYYGVAAQ